MTQDEKITIVMKWHFGFNIYVDIGAKEVSPRELRAREPALTTRDLYEAVKFACHTNQRRVFIIEEAAGVHRQEEKPEEELEIIERVNPKPALAELCIHIEGGQAVISPEGNIEFHDTGMNISLQDLQFVVQEAEAYMKYREERTDVQTETQ
jgi:hypothetical protein